MKILDELWYGNISPFQQCTRGDKRLKELLKLVARNREERVRQDTRRMRRKVRRADKTDESGDQSGKGETEKGSKRMKKATEFEKTDSVANQFLHRYNQRNDRRAPEKLAQLIFALLH